MKIEEMHELIVLARYLNFSKAAEKLFITQSALSHHVASMEKELGCKLLDRTQGVSLTAAGKLFLSEAERLVRAYDEVVRKCREAEKAASWKLVIEEPVDVPVANRLFELVTIDYTRRNPNVRLVLEQPYGHLVADSLLSGKADVCTVFTSRTVEDDPSLKGLVDTISISIPMDLGSGYYVWMEKSHPLAQRDCLSLDDLDGTVHIMPYDAAYQMHSDWVNLLAGKAGVRIDFSYRTGVRYSALLPLNKGDLFICWDNERKMPILRRHRNRVFIPLKDERLEFCLCFAWLSENDNPALASFIELLVELSAAQ